MKCAVLFDGCGLARLGLEQSGLICDGFEINPLIHYFGLKVGSGRLFLKDALSVDLSGYDYVWASPPCQSRSNASASSGSRNLFQETLEHIKKFQNIKYFWIENVLSNKDFQEGELYNAAQFLEFPIQNRPRLISGIFPKPNVFREYKNHYPGMNLVPTITASEYRYSKADKRRAGRFFKRKLTLEECAYYQGFHIPWNFKCFEKTQYKIIGNGVPVYMAKSFGEALK